MRKRTLFRQLLFITLLACLLTASLSAVIFSGSEIRAITERTSREMEPWARRISRMTVQYFGGEVSFDSYVDSAIRESHGFVIYIFDSEGNIILHSDDADTGASIRYLAPYVRMTISENRMVRSTGWRSAAGIFIGVPIFHNGSVDGAVFIVTPRNNAGEAIRSMILKVGLSALASICIMAVPVFAISRRISLPVLKMTRTAMDMASGNYLQSAPKGGSVELDHLGWSLDQLSGHLQETIEALKSSGARLQTILDNLTEGVIALDGAGKVQYHNPSALQLLMLDDTEKLREWLSKNPFPTDSGTSDPSPDSALMHFGDKILRIHRSSYGEYDGSGNAVFIIQDVSEYERLEQTRRDYVANVSHELRTPIASIRSLAEALNDGLIKDEEKRARYYEHILRESARMTRLINDLLELSKLQSGAVRPEKQIFSLGRLIEDVGERMALIADESGIRLSCDPPGEMISNSNKDMIEQVLVALIDNGIKYAEDEGTLTVRAKDDGNRWIVYVSNTGRFEKKDIDHLFERFYKADRSHSGGGTGLGLAITKELLTVLGETITAFNENDRAVFAFTVEKGYEQTDGGLKDAPDDA